MHSQLLAGFRRAGSIVAGRVLVRLGGGLARLTSHWGGTSLPGRVALWLYPSLLSDLASVYQRILVVTGTNGKTTTARALAEIMRQSRHYEVIAANPEGANLLSGVATGQPWRKPGGVRHAAGH